MGAARDGRLHLPLEGAALRHQRLRRLLVQRVVWVGILVVKHADRSLFTVMRIYDGVAWHQRLRRLLVEQLVEVEVLLNGVVKAVSDEVQANRSGRVL